MGFGRVSVRELILRESARPVVVKEDAILIRINQLYRSNMNSQELYEATRGVWKVGLRRYKAKYAMAVYQGIVREVYRIDRWVPAGFSEWSNVIRSPAQPTFLPELDAARCNVPQKDRGEAFGCQ
jgi:hypothetical protein